MLADRTIDVMLLATDLGVAKEFYGERIRLGVLIETEEFITFSAGGDSRLIVTKVNTGPRDERTKAVWRVGDVAAEVAELRSRGVEIAEYDLPDLKTVEGVADVGFALSAWFNDPSGNNISLLQFKDEALG